METEFEKRLAVLINEYSKENDSDTPDFILARYLNEVLKNFNAAVMDREQWYGRIQYVEDGHYKIPFDYDSTGNPNIIPTTISGVDGTTNIPSVDYSYSVKYGTITPIPITKPINQSNFSSELQEDIFKLEELGNKLLENIKKLRKL